MERIKRKLTAFVLSAVLTASTMLLTAFAAETDEAVSAAYRRNF